ncbi:unnamed protein product, partial [Pocillopora meandrina]
MDVKCSFSSLVGGSCSYDPRDRSRSTEVIPFLDCKRDIAGHKSSLSITDVETEIELILGRVPTSFSSELDLSELTICPRHRSSLGIGWRRGSSSSANLEARRTSPKNPKAERGLGKSACYLIWKKLGIFIPVGSGICRNCRINLDMQKIGEVSTKLPETKNLSYEETETIETSLSS